MVRTGVLLKPLLPAARATPLFGGTLAELGISLTFGWLEEEPHRHHWLITKPILGAIASLAILWGWARVATLVFATRTGILRPVEVVTAKQKRLVLPRDVSFANRVALIIVPEPKTWITGARF